MTINFNALRLDGIYQQNADNDLMLRVKIPAGVLSCEQADKIATIAEHFAGGRLHLTTRGSIELHGLRYEQLATIMPMLAAVGLTSRGACGGAVRGIVCSTSFAPGFAIVQSLARRLHRHFVGNPHFEGLPKKFKIAVEAGYSGARHLIQDLAIVCTDADAPRFDVWCAGGLGREPQPAFCFGHGLGETELLPLIEAVIRVYAAGTPAGKRLKHLLRDIGETEFRTRVALLQQHPGPELRPSVAGALVAEGSRVVTLPVFAGELSADGLRQAAALADRYCNGFLAVSVDQDLALPLADGKQEAALRRALLDQGLTDGKPQPVFRICPGCHECRMGLAPTRDIAAELVAGIGNTDIPASLAISGCPNCCSQPQLAEIGIVTRMRLRDENGNPDPRFELLQRRGEGFGTTVASDLDRDQLLQALRELID